MSWRIRATRNIAGLYGLVCVMRVRDRMPACEMNEASNLDCDWSIQPHPHSTFLPSYNTSHGRIECWCVELRSIESGRQTRVNHQALDASLVSICRILAVSAASCPIIPKSRLGGRICVFQSLDAATPVKCHESMIAPQPIPN